MTIRPYSPKRRLIPGILAAAAMALFAFPSAASADARDARRELNQVRIHIERELRARPEMKEAKQEWVDRRGEYIELRRAVVQTLLRDSRYLSLRSEMWGLQDELAALREEYRNGTPPMAQVNRLSLDIMDLRAYLSVLERRALERHQAALDAKEAYLAAGRRLLELHRGISEAVRQDARFRNARRVLAGATSSGVQSP